MMPRVWMEKNCNAPEDEKGRPEERSASRCMKPGLC